MFFRYAHMYRTRVNNRYVLMFEIRKKYYCTAFDCSLLQGHTIFANIFWKSSRFRKLFSPLHKTQGKVFYTKIN